MKLGSVRYYGYLIPLLTLFSCDNNLEVLPAVETALDGSYPIARPLLYYTDGEPEGVVKSFIDYCLSEGGQEKVTEVGYVPLP